MPGARGANARGPAAEAPRTPSDDASVPSKSTSQPLLTLKSIRNLYYSDLGLNNMQQMTLSSCNMTQTISVDV